jgi:hypothetical protein
LNHSFLASALDNTKCQLCTGSLEVHGKNVQCEACNNVGSVEQWHVNGRVMFICYECLSKEKQVKVVDIMERRERLDNQIQYREEVFNAEIVSISELKSAIYDSDIENKPYILAEQLMLRYNHFKQVIFDANQLAVDSANKQRAIQTELNQIANSLRQEEREKLRIQDINYKPQTVNLKKITTPKKPKLDKKEIAALSREHGIPEYMIQMVASQKNISPKEALVQIKESISTAKG